jgi:two-component system CheB/CheR fusion protein
MRVHPYRTLENVIEGAVITFVEITEQKRMLDDLRRSQESLRRLADVVRHVSDAVTMQDFDGRILGWNPAAERLFGWSEAEALALNFRDMLPDGSRTEVLALLRRLRKGETLEPLRVRRLIKNGRTVEVWLTVSALVNETGQLYALSTIEKQISEPAESCASP